MTTRPTRRLAVVVAFLCALTACTTQQRHAWLTFFFEGVPPLEGDAPTATVTPAMDSTPTRAIATSSNAEPVWISHAPYRDRKCDACHEVGQALALKGTPRDICLPCHTNVITGASTLHWPLKKGKCMACHRPHLATVPKLLTKPGVALCYECHTPLNVKERVHEPVRRGRCLACHTAHESAVQGLLRKPGNAVCARCHEPEPMQALAAHAGIGDRACLTCHDPHQAAVKGLLRESSSNQEPAP